jgi:hypothetical protein
MLFAARLYEYLRGASAPAMVPHGVPIGLEGPIN